MSLVEERKIGKIKITQSFMNELNENELKALNEELIPLNSKKEMSTGVIVYTAAHPSFQSLLEDEKIPFYVGHFDSGNERFWQWERV
jgi:hypothetical protein